MKPARPHAKRAKPATTWYDNQQRRRSSPFFRRIDRSFKFRVLIAAACSFALLSAVNRFEHCHTSRLEPDCLTSDYLDIISISNVETFSLVAAAFVYIFEAGKRKEREHHEMFDLLLAQRQAGASNSLGRIRALEDLSAAGLWQDGVDLQGADFSDADLTGADLSGADLTSARFARARLCQADLRGARLAGADFQDADLSGTLADQPLPASGAAASGDSQQFRSTCH